METVPPTPTRLRGQRSWTDAQRAEQARLLRQRHIWTKSTGPKSAKGKSISSRNSYKHGRFTAEMKALKQFIRMAITRNAKIKAFLKFQKQKRENELREKYGLPKYHRPLTKAFFPYFKVSPLTAQYWEYQRRKKYDENWAIKDFIASSRRKGDEA